MLRYFHPWRKLSSLKIITSSWFSRQTHPPNLHHTPSLASISQGRVVLLQLLRLKSWGHLDTSLFHPNPSSPPANPESSTFQRFGIQTSLFCMIGVIWSLIYMFCLFRDKVCTPRSNQRDSLLYIQNTSLYLPSQTTSHPAHHPPMTSHLTQNKIPSSKVTCLRDSVWCDQKAECLRSFNSFSGVSFSERLSLTRGYPPVTLSPARFQYVFSLSVEHSISTRSLTFVYHLLTIRPQRICCYFCRSQITARNKGGDV